MLSKDEIVDAIVEVTAEYTDEYFATFKKDLDKQLWAALHLGFVAAMKLNGYSQKLLDAAFSEAQDRVVAELE
jgi:hypothetical protein